ncbi:MAG: TRAP transporter substrate-binding protein [candidate division NC10 bacterium]|nr:TRAP transporter substrate-binding protein [candidate division NC10 bacterium]
MMVLSDRCIEREGLMRRIGRASVVTVCTVTLFLVSLTMGPVATRAAEKKIVITLGHVGFPKSLFSFTAQYFEKLVEGRTNGLVDVQVFHSSKLGKDKEMMEAVRLGSGSPHLALPSTVLPATDPIFGFQELPFLFKNRAHVTRVLEGRVGARLAKRLEKKGYVILGYWENGFWKITNNKRPIRTPADLKGIKLRTPKSPARMELFRTMGASPISMSFKEIYSALQQGVIDGQENSYAQIVSAKFYEVQKYLSISNHVYTPAYLVGNKKWFKGLPRDIQYVLLFSAHDAGRYARRKGAEMDRKLFKLLEPKMQVNKINRASFEKASQPLYDQYPKKFGAQSKWIFSEIMKAKKKKKK